MRIQQLLAGVALTAVMNVAFATNLFVGVNPVTGDPTFFIGSGVGSVTRGDAPASGVVLPAQQMQIFMGTETPPGGTVTSVDLDTFIQNVEPAVIEAIIRNKAAIDQENAAFIERQQASLGGGGQTQTPSTNTANQEDLKRIQNNLDNLVGNIINKAIEQGKVDRDQIQSVIDQVNQQLSKKIDLDNVKPLERSEQEQARLAQLEAERQKKREAEKDKQAQLKKQNEELQKKLEEQQAKQQAEKEKAAEAAKKKAAEEHAKKLADDKARAALEARQKALAEEKQKQAQQAAQREQSPPGTQAGGPSGTGGTGDDSQSGAPGTQGDGGQGGLLAGHGGDGGTGGQAGQGGVVSGNADQAGQGGAGGDGGQGGLLAGRGGDGGAGGQAGQGGAGGDGGQGGFLTGHGGDGGDGGAGGQVGQGGAGGDGGQGGLLAGRGGDGGAGGQAGQGGAGGDGGKGGLLAGRGGDGGAGGQAGQGGAGGDGGQGGLLAGRGGDGGVGGQAGQGGAPGNVSDGAASGSQGDGAPGPQADGPTGGGGAGGALGGLDPRQLALVGSNRLNQSQQQLGDNINRLREGQSLPVGASDGPPPGTPGTQDDEEDEPNVQATPGDDPSSTAPGSQQAVVTDGTPPSASPDANSTERQRLAERLAAQFGANAPTPPAPPAGDQTGSPPPGTAWAPEAGNRYDPNAPVNAETLRQLVNGSPLPPITPLSLADMLRQAMAGQPERGNPASNGDSAADDASKDKLLRDFVEQLAAGEQGAASEFPYIAAGDISGLPPTESLRGELSASYNGRVSGAFGDGTAVGGAMSLNVAFDDYAFTGDIVFDGGNGKAGVAGGWDAGVNRVDGSIYSPEPVYGGEVGGSLGGKFYGPKGQELGGNWSMEIHSGVRAGQSADGQFATKQ